MRKIKDITIEKAIVHIVDNSMDEPILSLKELYLNDDSLEFIGKHIAKVSSDDAAKYANFNAEPNIKEYCSAAIYEDGSFISASQKIARLYFTTSRADGLLPSSDLLIVKFSCEYGKMLAIIGLAYNKTFTHSIEYVDDDMTIDIKPHFVGLPDTVKKLSKCALVSFEDDNAELLVLNRPTKVEKSARSLNTFIDEILKCTCFNDSRDCTKTMALASEKWVRENLKEDAGKAEEVRREIDRALLTNEVVDINKLADDILDDNNKDEYIEYLKDSGVEDLVPIDREWVDKKLKRKKIKIDKDMELYISGEAYNDINRFQVKRNGDGTVDMIIRQVRRYFEKQ